MDDQNNQPQSPFNTNTEPATSPEEVPVPSPSTTEIPPATPAAPEPAFVPPTPHEPRNLLAALLLTSAFGYTGLHQVYLGRKTQGWIRFGLAIAAFPLAFILIGFFIVPVLSVWVIVDFFLVYFQRKDGEGQPLAASPRDAFVTKLIFYATIVFTALYLLGGLLLFSLGALNGLQQKAWQTEQTQSIQLYSNSREL